MSDDIDMAAGPELDERIAREVMGLEWRECKPYYAPEGWYPREHSGPTHGWDHPPGYHAELPMYSTDIAAAIEVLEKMREAAAVALVTCRSGWACDIAFGGFALDTGGGAAAHGVREYGEDNPALAICRAALAFRERFARSAPEVPDGV